MRTATIATCAVGGALLAVGAASAVPVLEERQNCAAEWSQCGGINYSGPTCCTSGNGCVELNPYYYQCQSDQGGQQSTTTTTTTTTTATATTTIAPTTSSTGSVATTTSATSSTTTGTTPATSGVFVSPGGSDSNSGTASSSPLLTLTAAQNLVRQQLQQPQTKDINVYLASGVYALSAPLILTAADSGNNGFKVNWIGSGAVISGGIAITGWTQGSNGVYSASIPVGTTSRNLYVGGKAANFARRKITRGDFSYTSTGMTWTNSEYDWLQTTAGIANAEVRFINSFTDRYSPIQSVGNRQLVMKQNAWADNLIGYDTVNAPNADFGVWVQNALALLTEGGEFFVDSQGGKVYYKPLNGENLATSSTYLAIEETLLAIGGTYASPSHDITFQNIGFAHSTWLKPSQGYGYVDQQTGGYIGSNQTYPQNFEASRPYWDQMPSAVQISAAQRISITGGNFTQLGSGGIGIGNDPNAHITGVGLGASDITVDSNYFTQVMGNSITGGGVQANAHHPSDSRMINTRITISNNIFFNNSALFSSTVPILTTYIQYSSIAHNDLDNTPYSGICYGYGWGSNDAGGSPEYQSRGLYNYQPLYTTPTTLQNNQILGNLVQQFGLSHTDLGGIYTLSKSPSTFITQNYVFNSGAYCLYDDEGSNSLSLTGNDCFTTGVFNAVNNGSGNRNTGNNTVSGNWAPGVGSPNFAASSVQQTGEEGLRTAYRAGVLPAKRNGRPVSNSPSIPDGFLTVVRGGSSATLNISNFDDVAFTGVSVTVSGGSLSAVSVPTTIPANSYAQAHYSGASGTVSATVRYTNPRTGASESLQASG